MLFNTVIKSRLTNNLLQLAQRNNNSINTNDSMLVSSLKKQLSAAGGKEILSGQTVLFYLDIMDFTKLEQMVSPETTQAILRTVSEDLQVLIPEIVPGDSRLVYTNRVIGDDFIALCAIKNKPTEEALENSAVTLELALKERMHKKFFQVPGWLFEVRVGFSYIFHEGERTFDYQIYLAYCEAQKMAHGLFDSKKVKLMLEFEEILKTKSLSAVFQPIVSLKNGTIFGWEALIRGPVGGHFFSPAILFSFAEEVNMLYPLEKICREIAVDTVGGLGPTQKLFLNVNPRTICDPAFVRGETLQYLHSAGFEAGDIVFEITEQTNIKNFPDFKKTLQHYRDQGYEIAIDDVGAGFSGLNNIALIRPDYLKIDMGLIRNINRDATKKALLETFVIFSEKIGCQIIAEGIETKNELLTLIKLGTHFGQGFLLAKPAYPKPTPAKEITTKIFAANLENKRQFLGRIIPVDNLMEIGEAVSGQMPVKDVKSIFDQDIEMSGLAVVEDNQPIGLIMAQNMHKKLSAQFGIALFAEKPISEIMDKHPLVVDIKTTLQDISQLAMSRENRRLYDLIVVTKEGNYAGVLSVQILLDTLSKMQIEAAQNVNPLTGLPGNKKIEEEIKARLDNTVPFSLIYGDLDNFKAYNDKYGFEQGDRILLLTAKIIQFCSKKYGLQDDFVGHIGGDDFVIISHPDCAERISTRIIKIFDRVVPGHYNSADRKQGVIRGKDKENVEKQFPFMGISLAVIEVNSNGDNDRRVTSLREIVGATAGLKKYAKSIPGSVYIKDRRSF